MFDTDSQRHRLTEHPAESHQYDFVLSLLLKVTQKGPHLLLTIVDDEDELRLPAHPADFCSVFRKQLLKVSVSFYNWNDDRDLGCVLQIR